MEKTAIARSVLHYDMQVKWDDARIIKVIENPFKGRENLEILKKKKFNNISAVNIIDSKAISSN